MHPNPAALSLSRKILRLLIVLTPIAGVLILALLIASLVAEDFVMKALTHHDPEAPQFVLGMRMIMVIGICSVPLAQIALTRLLAIVDTVNAGDPFVAENAERLQTIAWAALGLEVLHFVVGQVAEHVSTAAHPLDIHADFSVSRWLAVLLLFVLARVFDHGARMREDLQGTV
jgi:hypothetical protein